MLAITTKLEHIGHWIRMRQSLARFSASASSFHASSWADFITTTLAFRVFGTHKWLDWALRRDSARQAARIIAGPVRLSGTQNVVSGQARQVAIAMQMVGAGRIDHDPVRRRRGRSGRIAQRPCRQSLARFPVVVRIWMTSPAMSPRIIHIPLSGGDRKAQAKGYPVRARHPRQPLPHLMAAIALGRTALDDPFG
jgi:hypothetical protein